jgi:hypothetical protein
MVILKYWRLSDEDHRCPKCGGATVLLISERDGKKRVLRERCNCFQLSCDWEKEICDEEADC